MRRLDRGPARGSALEDSAVPPPSLSPASLRTGCADRKRVRPLLVGRNWRQGSLEETNPAWKTLTAVVGWAQLSTDGLPGLLTDAELS